MDAPSGPSGREFDELDGLQSAVDRLSDLPFEQLDESELVHVLRNLETERRRLAAVDQRLVAELEQRGVAAHLGYARTSALLVDVLRVAPAEAAARVTDARDLGPRRDLTGNPLPPVFAATAAAVAAGELSPAHARVITTTVDTLPAAVQAECDRDVEAFLVAQARELDPRRLATLARRLLDTLDPDGTLTTLEDRHRRRDLVVRSRPDGSARLSGELDAVTAEAVLTVLDTLARPAPAEDGRPDPRTPGQRRHDALRDAMTRLLRAGDLPACGGVAATIVVTMTAEQAASGRGLSRTGHGGWITVGEALQLAGDARVIPVVLGPTRSVEAYGSVQRIFTEQQRLALIARDGGCSFPGCSVPVGWCEAHHMTPFASTRRTRVDDGALLCGFHHREHERLGWRGRMIDGLPHWVPPPWIDPAQVPRRNEMNSQGDVRRHVDREPFR